MPKFFVFSDVHGYFTELQEALNEAGYDPTNENHWLISCGDNFDRGSETLAMFHFLLKSPRIILIQGNHETTLIELCDRGFPYDYDKSNGTVQTIKAFDQHAPFDVACITAYRSLRPILRKMRNYFETQHYVFVHGWIPIPCRTATMGCTIDAPSICQKQCINPNWRDAPYCEWEVARWKNGMEMARNGFIIPDKTIVCGHWHCSYGHFYKKMDNDLIPVDQLNYARKSNYDYFMYGDGADFSPFYDDGIIAIDACTAYTKKVNVIVLDDEFMEEI